MPGPIVAVTGHRPDKIGGYRIPNPTYSAVIRNLRAWLLELKPSVVLTGMALGVDQWMAELCISMEIPFTACLPMDEEAFSNRWPPASKVKLRYLLTKAHQVIVISKGGFEMWKLQDRNEWMVDNCNLLLAVFNGTEGGTANCIGYAYSVNRQVQFVDVPNADLVPEPTFVREAKPAPIIAQIMERSRTPAEEPAARPKYGRIFTGGDE